MITKHSPIRSGSWVYEGITPQIISSSEDGPGEGCVLVIPTTRHVASRVVESWMNLQCSFKRARVFVIGADVCTAYNSAVEHILSEFSGYKYMLTLEHDNLPPPDGAVRLIAQMEEHPELSAIGGLYYIKGEGGSAALWGDPNESPVSFYPKPARPGELVECCAVSMGFTIFRIDIFRDPSLRRPWFATDNYFVTQDFYAWHNLNQHGYRCAIDCSVPVGHYDVDRDKVW